MNIAVKSDIGKRRMVNEDAAGYFLNQKRKPLVVVCDGIGGYNAGEIASEVALSQLGKAWETTALDTIEESYQWVISTLQATNDVIFQQSQQEAALNGMGTTVVLAIMIDDQLLVAHVGDSRAYLWREGTMKQLTSDHSLVNALVQSGEITEQEALHHPSKHIVTQSLGITLGVEIEVGKTSLNPEDRILLCSDGLSDMLCFEELQAILKQPGTPHEQVEWAIKQANEAGGRDNITVAIIHLAEHKEEGVC